MMLRYQDCLRLLKIVTNDNADELIIFKKALDASPIKDPKFISAVYAPDKKSRQVKLANLLFKTSDPFSKKVNKILESMASSLPVFRVMLAKYEAILCTDLFYTELCTELCALSELTAEAKSILQALSDLRQIFDEQDSIKPLLQIVSGNDYFAQIAKSNPALALIMTGFFEDTFNTHLKITSSEAIEAKKKQALLDIPRESFCLKTGVPGQTIVATAKKDRYILSLVTSEMAENGTVVTTESNVLRIWSKEEISADKQIFFDDLLKLLTVHVRMDRAVLDFWKTCLFNQEGIHCFPAIIVESLQSIIFALPHFQGNNDHFLACLNLIQNALRMKKILFTFDGPHEFKLSWLGEEEHFMFTIKNKYLAKSAMDDDSLDSTQKKGNFQDIEVKLEKFCIPLNEAEFQNAKNIADTSYGKDCPNLTYQTCCDLFWATYANYVVTEKVKPKYLIEKENDLPALLMRCAADPKLKSQSEPERKNMIKAIAFHWLQLLNSQRQADVKAQMRLSTLDIVKQLPDEVKILFAIPSTSIFSSFWASLSKKAPVSENLVAGLPKIAPISSGPGSLQSIPMDFLAVSSARSFSDASMAETPQLGTEEIPVAISQIL